MAVRLQAAGLQQARFIDSQAQDALRNVGNGIALLGVERRGGRLNGGITRRRLEAGAWARLLTGLPRMTPCQAATSRAGPRRCDFIREDF